ESAVGRAPMRIPLIAGNWKMNTTLAEARALVQALLPEVAGVSGCDVVVGPPYISLTAVADIVRGSNVMVAGQNMFAEEKGAFTGEVSPLMIKEFCRYVILGH